MSDQSVENVLTQRGDRYGPFNGHAAITMKIKNTMFEALSRNQNYVYLREEDRYVVDEALSMIAHKIGRICNGDPTYDDNYVDIAGYAMLVPKNLGGKSL